MERQGAILIPYRKSAGFIARKAQSARSWFDLGFPFTGWTVVGRLAKQTSRTSRISLPQALLPQKSVSLPYLHDSCTHLAQPPPPKVPVILFFLSFYYTLSVDLYLPFFFHLKRFVRRSSLSLSPVFCCSLRGEHRFSRAESFIIARRVSLPDTRHKKPLTYVCRHL